MLHPPNTFPPCDCDLIVSLWHLPPLSPPLARWAVYLSFFHWILVSSFFFHYDYTWSLLYSAGKDGKADSTKLIIAHCSGKTGQSQHTYTYTHTHTSFWFFSWFIILNTYTHTSISSKWHFLSVTFLLAVYNTPRWLKNNWRSIIILNRRCFF